ncbi:MAG: hypothetical protein LBR30_04160 [Clostridioides sp.]|jgi:hypothetical protein|nr:hypothetical protein [Clostridioides sp.]
MEKLLEFIKKYNSEHKISDNSTPAEILKAKCHHMKSDEDWLALQKEIEEYVATNPPESEIEILIDFCEMVEMVCSAIRNDIFND